MVNYSKLFVSTFKPLWIYLSQPISQILPTHHISRQSDGTYYAGFPEHPHYQTILRFVRSTPVPWFTDLLSPQACYSYMAAPLRSNWTEALSNLSLSLVCVTISLTIRWTSTTPVRIVYDCSCHQSRHSEHPSLNDCLLTGPSFLNDLTAMLCFCTHKYSISTDIGKAFLHIVLDEKERNFTWFICIGFRILQSKQQVCYIRFLYSPIRICKLPIYAVCCT